MVIGVPKEIKDHEFRVALTPHGAKELCGRGHRVLVQQGAGEGSGFTDQAYLLAGANILPTAKQTFSDAQLILKVKEPQAEEWPLLRNDHVLFTYLHLAASKALTENLLQSGCTGIAYETTEDGQGQFPLLRPMSEIAGRMSVQIGAHYLEKLQGGSGTLLGGVPGVSPGEVVVLGSGVVGSSAVTIAVGMGAKVTVLSLDLEQLRALDVYYQNRIVTVASSQAMIQEYLTTCRPRHWVCLRAWGSNASGHYTSNGLGYETWVSYCGCVCGPGWLRGDHSSHDSHGSRMCR